MLYSEVLTCPPGNCMPAKKAKKPDFETALKELEKLLDNMESGELSLEESLKAFEQGVKLTAQCQKALSEAEQKVKILTEKNLEVDFITADQNTDE